MQELINLGLVEAHLWAECWLQFGDCLLWAGPGRMHCCSPMQNRRFEAFSLGIAGALEHILIHQPQWTEFQLQQPPMTLPRALNWEYDVLGDNLFSELELEMELLRGKEMGKHDFSSSRKSFRAEVITCCEQLWAWHDSSSAATICWWTAEKEQQ